MLHPLRSPSLSLKTNPPVPPCQGGKSDTLGEGFFNSPALLGFNHAFARTCSSGEILARV